MFKNFWYACGFSNEFTAQPKRVEMLGQMLAVYRDDRGQPVVLNDLCPHRGGSLAMGKRDGDCVRCPYHGWKFDSSGTCTEIPANTSKGVPKRARVDAYPTREAYGLLWAFMGDLPESERPPLPIFPEHGQPGWRAIHGTWDWNANYERVVENAADISHAPFVHAQSFGNPERPQVEDYALEETDWSITVHTTLWSPQARVMQLLGGGRGRYQPVAASPGVQMPCVTTLALDLPRGMKMRLFDVNVPVDATRTRTYWIMLRNFMPWRIFDGSVRNRVHQIFREDCPFVESQRPELVPSDLSDELHVKSDRMQLVYRRMRQALIDRGWGLDAHSMLTLEGKTAVVIPGPARREQGAEGTFVFDEVPTLGASPENEAEPKQDRPTGSD